MALTTGSNIVVAPSRAVALSEITHTRPEGRGGLSPVSNNLNAMHEYKRGNVVTDYSSSTMLNKAGESVEYRVKNLGMSGLTDETLRIKVLAERSGAGTFTVEVTNGSGTMAAEEVNDGNATTGIELVELAAGGSVFEAYDSGEYDDITVEVSADSEGSSSNIYGIYIGYERDKTTALTAVSAGDDSYDNGFIPQDESYYGPDDPLSAYKENSLSRNVKHLHDNRVGMICTLAYQNSQAPTVTDNFTVIDSVRPTGVLNSTWHLKTANDSGDVTIRTNKGDEITFSPSATGWQTPQNLTVGGASEVPEVIVFFVDGETTQIESLCAYWQDADL